ncbi:hypothetical protein JCM13210_02730 [Thermaerobacter litoralis]
MTLQGRDARRLWSKAGHGVRGRFELNARPGQFRLAPEAGRKSGGYGKLPARPARLQPKLPADDRQRLEPACLPALRRRRPKIRDGPAEPLRVTWIGPGRQGPDYGACAWRIAIPTSTRTRMMAGASCTRM